MRKTWTQIKNETMSKQDQQRAHALAMRDLAQMELSELRKVLKVSQAELAKRLKVTQTAISRLERRPNVLLETIHSYIEALGGRLELNAVLGNRTVRLKHLLAPARKKTGARKHNAAAATR